MCFSMKRMQCVNISKKNCQEDLFRLRHVEQLRACTHSGKSNISFDAQNVPSLSLTKLLERIIKASTAHVNFQKSKHVDTKNTCH